MKVTRENPPKAFVPVTITLETQGELDYIQALVCGSPQYIDEMFGVSNQAKDLADFLVDYESVNIKALNIKLED